MMIAGVMMTTILIVGVVFLVDCLIKRRKTDKVKENTNE